MHHVEPMPYGMYRVDKNYLDHMKSRQPKVMGSEETDLYCGPVLNVDGEFGFYFPATSMSEDRDADKRILSFIHVFKMLPCFAKVLNPDNEDTPESRYCLNEENRGFLEFMAKTLYETSEEMRENGEWEEK